MESDVKEGEVIRSEYPPIIKVPYIVTKNK